MRLALLCILLTGCAPYYIGHVVERDVFSRRVTVEVTNTHYIVAVSKEDTLKVGDKVKVDKESLIIIK